METNEMAGSGQGSSPWRIVGGMAGLVAILAIMTFSQANVQDEDAEANQVLSGGAFGYADPEGKRVLAPVDSGLARDMKRFTKAVAVPGRVVDVAFVEAKHTGEDGTTPLEPATFDATSGAVFTAGAGLAGGADVLVATEQFLADREVLPLTPLAHPDCAPQVAAALSERSGRAVAWCRDLAEVAGGGRLSLARFVPRGHDELVSLAYTGPGGPVYRDLPGMADPEGTWRAHDDGKFSAEQYLPLFAFRSKAGLEVAVRWSGSDGESIDLFRQEGSTFAPFVAAFRPRVDD